MYIQQLIEFDSINLFNYLGARSTIRAG
jgi:hypothetical protein